MRAIRTLTCTLARSGVGSREPGGRKSDVGHKNVPIRINEPFHKSHWFSYKLLFPSREEETKGQKGGERRIAGGC